MDLITAIRIVEFAIKATTGRSLVRMDETLADAGLIDANQRYLFRMHVGRGVRDVGHQIDLAVIPTRPDNTVREVVIALSSLPGRPTTGNDI